MEKPQYVLKLSLKELAIRTVVTGLWSQADILSLRKYFRRQSPTDDWTILPWQETMENKLKEIVPKLLIPVSLEEDLILLIRPIGIEILKWRRLHEPLFSNSDAVLNILDQLGWTSIGTVDYRKTAEVLIKQEHIDLTSRYKLACIYCLYDDIRMIWEKLSKDTESFLYNKVIPPPLVKQDIIMFWAYHMKEVDKQDKSLPRTTYERKRSLYKYAFENAALSGNKSATEYFFQKLEFEEKAASLVKITQRVVVKRSEDRYDNLYDFPKEKYCDVVCFLLTQMEEEEQVQVIKKFPYRTLRCFLDWPWQDLFMKVAEFMWNWDIFPADDYYSLILILSRNRTMSGYNYSELFVKFFLQAPSFYRKFIVKKHCDNGIWFRDLFYTNNTKMIKFVLRNVDNEDRSKFILCNPGCRLCLRLLKDDAWLLLELFVSECRLSSTDKMLLKQTFENYLKIFNNYGIKGTSRKVKTFFRLIDNGYLNKDIKRGTEEELKSIEAKRKRQYCEKRN